MPQVMPVARSPIINLSPFESVRTDASVVPVLSASIATVIFSVVI